MSETTMDSSETTADARGVSARPVEFPAVSGDRPMTGRMPLNRFYDVTVTITAELGRVNMPIGELVRLGEGSVIELHRGVNEAVDILAQGVPLAKGDIVAVDGRYAVRITEIVQNDREHNAPTRSSAHVAGT